MDTAVAHDPLTLALSPTGRGDFLKNDRMTKDE